MNNNFYTIPQDWYSEFNNTFMNPFDNNMIPNNISNTNNNNLADPKTGFLRGNMFNNLYDSYKNYKYGELKATNKKEELLFNILKYKFAMIELNLYLDINPMDTNMIELYNNYLAEEKKLCDEYEKKYGLLTLDSKYLARNKWNWIESPWPWEGTR